MGGIEVGVLREGEELDYCNQRNGGDAGNAPIAHVFLDTLCPGSAALVEERTLQDYETRNEGRRQHT